MAKKQKENDLKRNLEDRTYFGRQLPTVDVIEERTFKGLQYINAIPPGSLNDPDYVQESVRKSLHEWVRTVRRQYDILGEIRENADKNSYEYSEATTEMENLEKSFVTARSQLTGLNAHTQGLRNDLPNMSKGTSEESLYNNMLTGGAQADAVGFDSNGRLKFGSVYGKGKDDVSVLYFDDIKDTKTGINPIITEPGGTKAFIWKMAQITKLDSNSNKPFDRNWTYTKVFNNLIESGPQNTVGAAFADLAGDNESKSFAEMYEEGFKDPSYYIHPETGEELPKDNLWMKDMSNADVLAKFLGKYITSVMEDIYGPVIDEETGLVDKTQSQLAQDLIKKYSK